MPFQRRYDTIGRRFIVDRDLTGPQKPVVFTGTVKSEDGTIIGTSDTIDIPPATPVQVNLPSPFEPIIDANNRITPSWWKFLNELYQRTGGINDNVNQVPTIALGGVTTATLITTGNAPTVEIDHIRMVGSTSMAFTGTAPTVQITHIRMPGTDALIFTGNIPVVP